MILRAHGPGTARPEVHVLMPFTREGGTPASVGCGTLEFQERLIEGILAAAPVRRPAPIERV